MARVAAMGDVSTNIRDASTDRLRPLKGPVVTSQLGGSRPVVNGPVVGAV